ncbi:MAG: response regulator transcription factor [Eubacterium sp.]|nr:response regulator transcription factor [Eubacterium sp.]
MIYYVEDDKSIRELVVYTLGSTGLEAQGFGCGADFERAMREKRPDLILLDIMLPGESGITLLKKIRSNPETRDIPIIMATAKGKEYDKVQALDLGADDYVTKPYGMMELVSRIKAVLRRSRRGGSSEEILKAGSIVMETAKHRVSVNGEEITLTFKEYEMLKYLMQNTGVVLTRDQLLVKIWGYDFDGETRTVDVHVRTLRQKLGDAGSCIETVRGVGYKIAEV